MPLRRAKPSAAGTPGLGHAHHHVGLDRRLLGELLADVDAGLVHALAVEAGVGSGEVDELEQAELRVDPLVGEGLERPRAGGVDHDHLAGQELADEVGADDVEGRALRRQHPAAVLELAEAQRAEPVRVAHADHPRLVHDHEREGALEARQHLGERPLEVAARRCVLGEVGQLVADQLGDEVGVARDGAGQHPGLGGQRLGVGEVAVVAEGEVAVAGPVGRLRVAPRGRAGGGVAAVADGEVAGEAGEGRGRRTPTRRGPGP